MPSLNTLKYDRQLSSIEIKRANENSLRNTFQILDMSSNNGRDSSAPSDIPSVSELTTCSIAMHNGDADTLDDQQYEILLGEQEKLEEEKAQLEAQNEALKLKKQSIEASMEGIVQEISDSKSVGSIKRKAVN